jgi:hypothetical protein
VSADALYFPLALAFYGVSRSRARAGFDAFAPALGLPQQDREAARAAFLRFGPWVAIIATLAGGAMGLASLFGDDSTGGKVFSSPLAIVVIGVFGLFVAYGTFIAGVLFVVTVIARITRLHRAATTVDIFRTGPAHAFAPVTAGLSGFVVVVVTYSLVTDESTAGTVFGRVFAGAMVVFALLVFAVPLLGMRSRLREAKEAALDASLARREQTMARIAAAIDAGQDQMVGALNDSIDALVAEEGRIRRASTWPWDAGTARGVLTTVLLPIVTWAATAGLGKLLDL